MKRTTWGSDPEKLGKLLRIGADEDAAKQSAPSGGVNGADAKAEHESRDDDRD